MAGSTEAVMPQLAFAVPIAESAALTVKEVSPAAVGVPVIIPVEVFRVKPGGSVPVIEYV